MALNKFYFFLIQEEIIYPKMPKLQKNHLYKDYTPDNNQEVIRQIRIKILVQPILEQKETKSKETQILCYQRISIAQIKIIKQIRGLFKMKNKRKSGQKKQSITLKQASFTKQPINLNQKSLNTLEKKRSTSKKSKEYFFDRKDSTKTKKQVKSTKKLSEYPIKHRSQSQKTRKAFQIAQSIFPSLQTNLVKAKKIDEYFKVKILSSQKGRSLGMESTCFFPKAIASEEKPQNCVSQFVNSQSSEVEDLHSLQFSYLRPNNSIQDPPSQLVLLHQWQNYETLRLKNLELSNYVEELELIQKKDAQQRQKRANNIEHQLRSQIQILRKQKQQLSKSRYQLCQANSSLQQMFNQSQHELEQIKGSNTLKQQKSIILLKTNFIQRINAIEQKNKSLENQLREAHSKIEYLSQSNRLIEAKYRQNCCDKQQIKRYAEQLLENIRLLQSESQ